jgi:hypothetical protein
MNERTVFITALEKEDLAQRKQYLEEACAGDPALRDRVEALLRSHEREGEFLDVPAAAQLAGADVTREEILAADTGGDTLEFLTPSDKPGSLGRLGHYDIQEVIGRGGMGIVLRALDDKLHRVVAIKVMAPQLATSSNARKRFIREAQAAAAVRDDHVIGIYAVEEAEELPYLVMEYISGESLQQRLDRNGPLELNEILRIGHQTACGLAAAHAQGLIHRDVKPANILLENGVERVKITDFGLARAVDDASLTQSGVVAGTPQYMAPEQAQGGVVDHRADLFSLGSVLYAACTGRAPFRASGSMAVLKRVCEVAPSPIRQSHPETPQWLVDIITKLHAKDPADRFQSAAEVAELLANHLAHIQDPSVAPLPQLVAVASKARPPVHKRRLVIAAAAVLCFVAGLSVTEATEVTNLRATMIRIFTPDGTLVVETDDPGVRVTIEGDGGLVITGAGFEEIRLRPGSYRVLADKDGKRIPLEKELVSIARGGREIVKVKVKGGPAKAVENAEKGAFVVLGGKGVGERKFDTLAEAALGASSDDIIEVRGNGPFVTPPIKLGQTALTIRAGGSFRPIIKLRPDALDPDAALLHTGAPLVLEGLELQRIDQTHLKDHQGCMVKCELTSFWCANCRFVMTLPRAFCINCQQSQKWVVRNCEFMTSDLALDWWHPPAGGRGLMENCLLIRSHAVQAWCDSEVENASISLTRNTIVGPQFPAVGFNVLMTPNLVEGGPAIQPLQLKTSANIFDAESVLMFDQQIKKLAPLKGEAAEAFLLRFVDWREERNLYVPGATTVTWGVNYMTVAAHGPKGLANWNRFWRQADTGSLEGRVRYQGGNVLGKLSLTPEKLTPEDVRLRPDSAGYRAGKDDKDLGADVDLVGPGKAYERWKMTPEYQQWLKDTGQKK